MKDIELPQWLDDVDAHNNSLQEGNQTMEDVLIVIKDPICGMAVDRATAIHTELGGKTFYFCSDHCRRAFLAPPAGAKPKGKSGGCCS